MEEYEVRVEKTQTPQKPPRGPGIGAMLAALLRRPVWLVLGGLAVFVLTVGTPHVGWDYDCRHPRRMGEPCRYYDYCAYYGIQGRRVLFDEECGNFVKFLPIQWGRLLGKSGRP